MNSESLLNPTGESHVLMETSDQKIGPFSMQSRHVRTIDINGYDVDNDPVEPLPTRREYQPSKNTPII